MIKLLRGFAYVWGTLVGLSVLIGIVGIWWKEGFVAARDMMNPFNLWNYALIVVLSLPSVAAQALAQKLANRRSTTSK